MRNTLRVRRHLSAVTIATIMVGLGACSGEQSAEESASLVQDIVEDSTELTNNDEATSERAGLVGQVIQEEYPETLNSEEQLPENSLTDSPMRLSTDHIDDTEYQRYEIPGIGFSYEIPIEFSAIAEPTIKNNATKTNGVIISHRLRMEEGSKKWVNLEVSCLDRDPSKPTTFQAAYDREYEERLEQRNRMIELGATEANDAPLIYSSHDESYETWVIEGVHYYWGNDEWAQNWDSTGHWSGVGSGCRAGWEITYLPLTPTDLEKASLWINHFYDTIVPGDFSKQLADADNLYAWLTHNYELHK